MMTIFLRYIFSVFILLSCVKANEKENRHDDGARCTGSSSCTACSNCSRCAHCGSGGTCGVCRGSSSRINFYSSHSSKTIKKTSKKTKSNSALTKKSKQKTRNHSLGLNSKSQNITSLNSTSIVVSGKFFYVKSKFIEIRKYPKIDADVIATINKGKRLIYLGKVDSWYKIKIPSNKKVGYVYANNMK